MKRYILSKAMPIGKYIEEQVRESYRDGFKKRRSSLEIMGDILSVAMEEAKKTEIVNKAGLNFRRAEKYLSYLEALGALENIHNEYKTTEKGLQLLRDYQKIKDQLK